jgi:hypothetical protein
MRSKFCSEASLGLPESIQKLVEWEQLAYRRFGAESEDLRLEMFLLLIEDEPNIFEEAIHLMRQEAFETGDSEDSGYEEHDGGYGYGEDLDEQDKQNDFCLAVNHVRSSKSCAFLRGKIRSDTREIKRQMICL